MNRRILSFILALAAVLGLQAATVTFTPDDLSDDFHNPERGYYQMVSVKLKGNGMGRIGDTYFTQGNQAARSLIMRHYYLDRYADGSAITEEDLDLLEKDFAKFRAHGYKMIVRFSYGETFSSETSFSHEATEAQMYAHMEQIKPILAANADVIAFVQAGFVGVWGEWYYSYQFGVGFQNDHDAPNRVIDHLLDMTPSDRFVQLRTPDFIANYVGGGWAKANWTDTLTVDSAFSGSNRARLAHHNDAFANGATNQGTYSGNATIREAQRTYLANLDLYSPTGGESTLGTWASGYQNIYNLYCTGPVVDAELAYLHYDFLNYEYSDYVTREWKKEKCGNISWYDMISRKLGYRFELVNATFPDQVAAGDTVQLHLQIRNNGYGCLYNMRKAYLVLRSAERQYSLMLATDPRLWAPNGAITDITEQIALPQHLVGDTYQLSLALPDPYASIALNPKYAVRFANPDVWNYETGDNSLQSSISIDGPAAAVSSIEQTTPRATKLMRNGQIIILRDGVEYNALGQRIE